MTARKVRDVTMTAATIVFLGAAVTFCGMLFSVATDRQEIAKEEIAPAPIDQYVIINIRLLAEQTGLDSYMFDYTKNNEPMPTIWFPNHERLELYIAHLNATGDVIELGEELP